MLPRILLAVCLIQLVFGAPQKQNKLTDNLAIFSESIEGLQAPCGNRKFVPRDEICCGEAILDRTGVLPACCGNHQFDRYYNMCCGGIVKRKPSPKAACCGSHTYNVDLGICCDGKLNGRGGPHSDCCGKNAFDSSVEACCDGKKVCPKEDKKGK